MNNSGDCSIRVFSQYVYVLTPRSHYLLTKVEHGTARHETNCSVDQSSRAELGPAWHNKERWAGTGWPRIGCSVNAF